MYSCSAFFNVFYMITTYNYLQITFAMMKFSILLQMYRLVLYGWVRLCLFVALKIRIVGNRICSHPWMKTQATEIHIDSRILWA